MSDPKKDDDKNNDDNGNGDEENDEPRDNWSEKGKKYDDAIADAVKDVKEGNYPGANKDR